VCEVNYSQHALGQNAVCIFIIIFMRQHVDVFGVVASVDVVVHVVDVSGAVVAVDVVVHVVDVFGVVVSTDVVVFYVVIDDGLSKLLFSLELMITLLLF